MGHHHHHQHGSADDGGVSQRVNSPRFSGPMTRRGHSFKRTTTTTAQTKDSAHVNNCNGTTAHHEVIDLQINSPRSENGTIHQAAAFDLPVDRKQAHHRYNLRERVSLLRKPMDYVVGDLGSKERKKLGHLMFLLFCGVCLFLGVFKICANGWFGSAIERVESDRVSWFICLLE